VPAERCSSVRIVKTVGKKRGLMLTLYLRRVSEKHVEKEKPLRGGEEFLFCGQKRGCKQLDWGALRVAGAKGTVKI